MKKKSIPKSIRKRINAMTLPSRPTVMLAFMKAQEAFAPDLDRWVEIIRHDLLMSSTILQEANRQIEGRKREIASIPEAVTLLGLEQVREIITHLFLVTDLIRRDVPLQAQRRLSARIAWASYHLAPILAETAPNHLNGYLPPIDPEEAYTLGLFYHVGVIVMMRAFGGYTDFHLDQDRPGGKALLELEKSRYGINHSQVGALLCDQWSLPSWLSDMVEHHHNIGHFARAGGRLDQRLRVARQGLLGLAEWVCDASARSDWQVMRQQLQQFFGLTPEQLNQLRDQAQAAMPSLEFAN